MKGNAKPSRSGTGWGLIAITKILLGILSLLLLAIPVQAQPPSYGGIKLLAEQHDPTNSIPHEERIYFCTEWGIPEKSFIREFEDGITIRRLIDETKFKGKDVEVSVYRRDAPKNFGIVFHSTINPTNTPSFQLKAEDAILFMDPREMRPF